MNTQLNNLETAALARAAQCQALLIYVADLHTQGKLTDDESRAIVRQLENGYCDAAELDIELSLARYMMRVAAPADPNPSFTIPEGELAA